MDFLVHRKYALTLLRRENFFSLKRSNGVSKNPPFYTDFRDVHQTLVKSAPQKVLPKNRFFWDFWLAKTFFWLHFLLRSNFHTSVWKYESFDIPFHMFEEKKNSSLWRAMNNFWELSNVKNARNRSMFQKTVFINRS